MEAGDRQLPSGFWEDSGGGDFLNVCFCWVTKAGGFHLPLRTCRDTWDHPGMCLHQGYVLVQYNQTLQIP